MPEEGKSSSRLARLSGMGIELAAAVAGLSLFGYWWDRHFGTAPWGLVVGGTIGIVGGMYNLIRQSLSAIQEAGRKDGDDKR